MWKPMQYSCRNTKNTELEPKPQNDFLNESLQTKIQGNFNRYFLCGTLTYLCRCGLNLTRWVQTISLYLNNDTGFRMNTR